MADIVIEDGFVVSPTKIERASVAIEAGEILKIGAKDSMPSGKQKIRANGKYILPGFIDHHLHYGILGPGKDFVSKVERDIDPETLAAAYGGVTTLFPMLSGLGPYKPMVERLRKYAEGHSYVNISFSIVVQTDEHIDEIPELYDIGVAAYKHFFNPYKGEEGEKINLFPVTEGQLLRSLIAIREMGGPAVAMIHAEDCDLYTFYVEQAKSRGLEGLVGWAEGRPNICEFSRVQFACTIASETKAPIHFVHISTGESVDIIGKFQKMGINVSAESVPANLAGSMYNTDIGVWGKFCPPIRGPEQSEMLWQGIRSGVIQHIGTDHVSYTREEKEAGQGKFGDIWEVPPGISNVHEHWLPVLVTYGIKAGRISLQKMVEVCSENNAKRFGLYPRKGAIAEGMDADILVVDLDAKRKVDEDFYHGRGKGFSIHWGETLYGLVTHTIVGGNIVIEDGKAVGSPGIGKFCPQR